MNDWGEREAEKKERMCERVRIRQRAEGAKTEGGGKKRREDHFEKTEIS